MATHRRLGIGDAAPEARRRPGLLSIAIWASRPDRRKRDLDNLAKATLDLLTAHRVIEDDAKVTSLIVRWDDDVPAGRLVISVHREPAAN